MCRTSHGAAGASVVTKPAAWPSTRYAERGASDRSDYGNIGAARVTNIT